MSSSHTRQVSNRLRTARGHLDAVIRMVEDEAYCPDILKQMTAVQGLLEGSGRMVFRNHLETCVAKAMQEGRTEEIVDELMETLKFDKRLLRPTPEETTKGGATMAVETIHVPEIHCGHCKASIEGALQPLDGVASATVDVDARLVTVDYDTDRLDRSDLVREIEDQGYEVPA